MPVEKPSLMFSARRRLFYRTRLQLLRRFRRGADAAGSCRCSTRITPILFCNEQQRAAAYRSSASCSVFGSLVMECAKAGSCKKQRRFPEIIYRRAPPRLDYMSAAL